MKNERFLWLDIETNGTDPKKHVIFEVACVVTDSDFQEITGGAFSEVIWHPSTVVENVSPFIQQMHGPSGTQLNGLLWDVRRSVDETSDVEKKLLKFLHLHGVKPGQGILAGSSIHFDRAFLAHHMPLLEAFFYHRMFDVSAFKTAGELWGPPKLIPEPKKEHRALADVYESLELGRTFRRTLMSLPIPDVIPRLTTA